MSAENTAVRIGAGAYLSIRDFGADRRAKRAMTNQRRWKTKRHGQPHAHDIAKRRTIGGRRSLADLASAIRSPRVSRVEQQFACDSYESCHRLSCWQIVEIEKIHNCQQDLSSLELN
ncbi:hypothetical protein [Novipirellula rosea]|uniref:hypothetical protein n=1 Tax=Novipirellula rosea TaxID=1031540 RepID=UPI0031E762AE